MKAELANSIACPVCFGKVAFMEKDNEIVCPSCQLAYPIQEGIPVMLSTEARSLSSQSSSSDALPNQQEA